MSEALNLVKLRAEDDGLWFVAETVSEAYLQRALRQLHHVIELDANPIIDPRPQAYRELFDAAQAMLSRLRRLSPVDRPISQFNQLEDAINAVREAHQMPPEGDIR